MAAKKGDIWVSAVLYIALGMVLITLILSAGIPLVNKMRDKNTISQTKKLLHAIDENIRTVANEGPGSKRYLSPVEVSSGVLAIEDKNSDDDEALGEIIQWNITTANKLMEPGMDFPEGSLIMRMEEGVLEDEYILSITARYKDVANLTLNSKFQNTMTGRYSVTIEHAGDYGENGIPEIRITVR